MRRFTCLGFALCIVLLTGPVSAASLTASGVAIGTPVGSDWSYSMTLTNSSSSTVSLATFWFGWVPGEDFLPHAPISESAPSNWAVNAITNGGAGDGYAIRYEATATAGDLAPGSSLVFGFMSHDSPTVLAGDSPFYPGTPAGTSFVYQGGPFSGASDQFIVTFQSVPEPSALLLGVIGAAASFVYARTRRRRSH